VRAAASARQTERGEAWDEALLQAGADLPWVAGWICGFRLEHGDADVRFDVTGREHVAWSPFRC